MRQRQLRHFVQLVQQGGVVHPSIYMTAKECREVAKRVSGYRNIAYTQVVRSGAGGTLHTEQVYQDGVELPGAKGGNW